LFVRRDLKMSVCEMARFAIAGLMERNKRKLLLIKELIYYSSLTSPCCCLQCCWFFVIIIVRLIVANDCCIVRPVCGASMAHAVCIGAAASSVGPLACVSVIVPWVESSRLLFLYSGVLLGVFPDPVRFVGAGMESGVCSMHLLHKNNDWY